MSLYQEAHPSFIRIVPRAYVPKPRVQTHLSLLNKPNQSFSRSCLINMTRVHAGTSLNFQVSCCNLCVNSIQNICTNCAAPFAFRTVQQLIPFSYTGRESESHRAYCVYYVYTRRLVAHCFLVRHGLALQSFFIFNFSISMYPFFLLHKRP